MVISMVSFVIVMTMKRSYRKFDVQKSVLALCVLLCAGLSVRCVDPFGWRRDVHITVIQLAYEVSSLSVYAAMFTLGYDWIRIVFTTTGELERLPTYRKFMKGVLAAEVVAYLILATLQVNQNEFWLWRSLKNTIGAITLTTLVWILAGRGYYIYGILRAEEIRARSLIALDPQDISNRKLGASHPAAAAAAAAAAAGADTGGADNGGADADDLDLRGISEYDPDHEEDIEADAGAVNVHATSDDTSTTATAPHSMGTVSETDTGTQSDRMKPKHVNRLGRSRIRRVLNLIMLTVAAGTICVLILFYIVIDSINSRYTLDDPAPVPTTLGDVLFEGAFDILHALTACIILFFFWPKKQLLMSARNVNRASATQDSATLDAEDHESI
jgi:hypothetical protein